MDKFAKKIRKIFKNPENAIVIGKGFGNLSSILSAHNTAFVIEPENLDIKAKNLVYIESFDFLHLLYGVRIIYFDLDKIHYLEKMKKYWNTHNALIIIEGSEPIGREFSKPLYDTGWNCTSTDKHFHIWEKKK